MRVCRCVFRLHVRVLSVGKTMSTRKKVTSSRNLTSSIYPSFSSRVQHGASGMEAFDIEAAHKKTGTQRKQQETSRLNAHDVFLHPSKRKQRNRSIDLQTKTFGSKMLGMCFQCVRTALLQLLHTEATGLTIRSEDCQLPSQKKAVINAA